MIRTTKSFFGFALVIASALAMTETASAQFTRFPQTGQPQVFPQTGQAQFFPQTGQPQVFPQTGQAQWFPPVQPSFPVHVTPNQIVGVNPWTGGLNTANTQVNNTAFDAFRNDSMNNGTMRPVNRPVYNPQGQVIGWERGMEWNNSLTGQLHGQTQVITPNGMGGTNTTQTFRSGAPRPR